MSAIRRLYVRKKEGFRQGEESLTSQLNEVLGNRLAETAVYHRYDVDGLTEEDYITVSGWQNLWKLQWK